jgi:hypothetical protein
MSAKYPKIQFRRATEAEFLSASTVLASGEPGWATDSKVLKVGNGLTSWASLSGVGVLPTNVVFSTTTDIPNASGITNIVQISQANFNALGSYSPNTAYLIVG